MSAVYKVTIFNPYRSRQWFTVVEGEEVSLRLDHAQSEARSDAIRQALGDGWQADGVSEDGDALWVFLSVDAGRALVKAVS